MRGHFQEVRRTEQPGCVAGEAAWFDVTFAKLPQVQVRWGTNIFSEGGGANVDLALSVTARRCDGQQLWHTVATGYGSEERPGYGFLWVNPASDQFRPAADSALAQLARNLDADLSGMRLAREEAT